MKLEFKINGKYYFSWKVLNLRIIIMVLIYFFVEIGLNLSISMKGVWKDENVIKVKGKECFIEWVYSFFLVIFI